VQQLIDAVGADAVVLSADAHDAGVALLSHLPQVLASALAASLVASPGVRDDGWLQLAGPGIVDTTRLAASDADLWLQILELNAGEVAPAVAALAGRLHSVAEALHTLAGPADATVLAQATAAVRDLLREGNVGRALLPLKRGVRAEAFAPVRVTVPDEPGQLARLLADSGVSDVNVEDVRVEHVPGRPWGIIELLVRLEDTGRLSGGLRQRGWDVLAGSP
jgi:prephenate dehydrogenase